MFKKIVLLGIIYLSTGIAFSSQLLDRVVAVVNNSVITASELNAQVEQSKKQMAAQQMKIPEDKVLRKEVLQHLIDVDLQLQIAKQHNIAVESKEIDAAIAQIATTNQITEEQLKEELLKQGMSWDEYRKSIRKEMVIGRLQQQAVGKDVLVTKEQIDHYLKTAPPTPNNSAVYHLQNIVIPLSEEASATELKNAKQLADKALNKIQKGADLSQVAVELSTESMALESDDLGERHLAELPDIFAKEVVTMKLGQVSGPIRAGNGFHIIKLVSLAGENPQHVITETHVRHILLKPDASMLPDEAKKQVQNLYQQITSGKDFTVMAKKYSLDVATAVKGGDLGWVKAGELVPEFEKTMNQLPLHKVSKPVKSKFGWHLIEVLERRQKDDTAAYKRQKVQQILQQRKFAELIQSWQQQMRGQAYINIIDKDLA